MVEHLVLFKLKPDVTEDQKEQMIEGLRSLQEKIPGILHLSAGGNFSDRSQGYEIGLSVRFVDRQALDVYIPHPAHRECVDRFITPIKTDVIVVDYEFD